MYPSYASDTNCVGDGCVGLRIIAAMSEPIEKPVQPPKWAPRAKRRMADLGITLDIHPVAFFELQRPEDTKCS